MGRAIVWESPTPAMTQTYCEPQGPYLQHVIINVSERKIEMHSDHGDYQFVQWKWDKEGYEGFTDTWQQIAQSSSPQIPYSVKL